MNYALHKQYLIFGALAFSAIFIISCLYNNTITEKNLLSIPVVSSEIIQNKAFDKSLNTLGFNKTALESDVISMVIQAFYKHNSRSFNLSFNKVNNDDFSLYYITIIFDEIPDDDSISAYRYDIELRKNIESGWKVSQAKQSWRCWPNRGHRDFSIEPCS